MIKYLKIILICLMFPFFTISCNANVVKTLKAPLKITKPSLNLYTDSLIRILNNSKDITISIFYPKLGKNKTIPAEYMESFNTFMKSIKKEDFIDPSTVDIDINNPEYKLTIYLKDKSIFVINILNDKYITIHPWDGSYEPDLIDISHLHTGTNIFNTVDYLIKYQKQ